MAVPQINNLKYDHPALYQRVRTKAIVHVVLGVALLLSPPINTANASTTSLVTTLGLRFWGFVFLGIGILITLGLFKSRQNYRLARLSLAVATGHAMMWLLALALPVASNWPSQGMAVLVLWGYLTYNLFHIVSDPGWTTIDILKSVDLEDHNGRR